MLSPLRGCLESFPPTTRSPRREGEQLRGIAVDETPQSRETAAATSPMRQHGVADTNHTHSRETATATLQLHLPPPLRGSITGMSTCVFIGTGTWGCVLLAGARKPDPRLFAATAPRFENPWPTIPRAYPQGYLLPPLCGRLKPVRPPPGCEWQTTAGLPYFAVDEIAAPAFNRDGPFVSVVGSTAGYWQHRFFPVHRAWLA